MFSFHKPKVYRSTQGCCICKAKSSSSRFTDSKKYETDFIECFQLLTPRKGEICNACVLLVKRFKRLPPDSDRHWGHVVDARVGPGLKSMTKFKKRKEEQLLLQQNGGVKSSSCSAAMSTAVSSKSMPTVSERFGKIFKKTKKKKTFEPPTRGSSDENSSPASPVSNHSDGEDHKPVNLPSPFDLFQPIEAMSNRMRTGKHQHSRTIPKCHRKSYRPLKNRSVIQASLVSDNGWTRLSTCCGIVYENKAISAVLIDASTFVACAAHISKPVQIAATTTMIAPHSRRDVLIRHINNTTNYILNAQVFTSTVAPAAGGHLTTTATTNVLAAAPIANRIEFLINNNANTTEPIKFKQFTHESGHILKNTLKAAKGVDGKSKAIVKGNLLKVARNGVLERIGPVLERLGAPTTLVAPNADMLVAGRIISKAGPLTVSDKLIDAIGHKFNDNSSDSGYDEILQEPKKLKPGVVRPVILANGIKLHVQPQNLVLAANLAGVSRINNQLIATHAQNVGLGTPIHDIIQNQVISSTTNNSA